jgi:hypothetical protein
MVPVRAVCAAAFALCSRAGAWHAARVGSLQQRTKKKRESLFLRACSDYNDALPRN